ncbi:MAG TPA: DoxX family membrane protein [Kofleriaceae bacterium]|nr:DoxX family membrane protein [Kofleriaceae bacterium]
MATTPAPRAPWTDAQLAHLALRIVLGLNIATHGAVRLPDLGVFVDKTAAGFAKTPLPAPLVIGFLYATPIVELVLGLAMLLGVRLRITLFAGALMIGALTVGMSLQQQWEIVGLQLIYALAYFILIARAADARLTVAA